MTISNDISISDCTITDQSKPQTISNPYIIDEICAEKATNTIILVGSIHGNEREGFEAIKRLFNNLHHHCPINNTHIVGICANPEALKANKRFIHEDLNRLWDDQILEHIHSMNPKEHNLKQRMVIKLYSMISSFIKSTKNHLHIIDLHTFSSYGDSFIMSRLDNNLAVCLNHQYNIPMILNERDYIKNTLVGYWSRKNINAIIVEGGKKGINKTIDNIHYILHKVIEIFAEKYDHISHDLTKTHTLSSNPIRYSICYRHPVSSKNQFKMQPNYLNFQKIKKGEFLAVENGTPVLSKQDGYILFPLYQQKGNDGFFIVKQVH